MSQEYVPDYIFEQIANYLETYHPDGLFPEIDRFHWTKGIIKVPPDQLWSLEHAQLSFHYPNLEDFLAEGAERGFFELSRSFSGELKITANT